MKVSTIKHILSIISLNFFLFLAVGSLDEEPEHVIQDTWEESENTWSVEEEIVSVDNDWLIGIWSNRGYTQSGANMTLKLQLNPNGKGRLYMLEQWLECTYKVYDDVVIATRNGVDIQYSFDRDKKSVYMADGSRLYKQ